MMHFLPRQFCRRKPQIFSLSCLIFSFSRDRRYVLYPARALCGGLFVFLLGFPMCAEMIGYAPGNQMERVEQKGDSEWNGEAEPLFMTIYDTNGAKRLLSSKHPAVLTQGLYFTFPSDVRECEISQNNGEWEKAEKQVYLDPNRSANAVLYVQFRARESDGRVHYSRSFVMMGGK